MTKTEKASSRPAMIDFIFTLDYEIYGNGEGSLTELVYEPAEKLLALFRQHGARMVLFVEAAELEKIQEFKTDACIDEVRRQVRGAYKEGFEIGLHLHPQWYNARYENRKWLLDYTEYNICTLPRRRIASIIDRSVDYVRNMVDKPDFTPLSFRAGNWLLQPTPTVADVLIKKGIRIESSVFKGGLQRAHGLDYRAALKNGYYWPFRNDVNACEPDGELIEIPTYTVMTPFWSLLTAKRVGLQRRNPGPSNGAGKKITRYMDYLRPRYPLKLDFCRMTSDELICTVDRALRDDLESTAAYRPVVAIGHTKDLVDLDAVDRLLSYLKENKIRIATFREAYSRCRRPVPDMIQ